MRLAVIPARGGSKRIPRKNIKSFCGHPMLSYSIKAAQKSGVFDDIIVSTDDIEIAELAEKLGANVPFMRPGDLSDDFVGTRPVTNHAIATYSETVEPVTFCCCIYATAPFIQPEFLRQGYQALLDAPKKAFAFSVTSFAFPIQRALRIVEQGGQNTGVGIMYPDSINKRSQDLEEAFHDAGQFYWGTADGYNSSKGMFSEHSIPVVLPRHLVQDIDTQEDWQRAELMYQAYVKHALT